MKTLIMILTLCTVGLMAQVSGPPPKPEAFRDPFRKVKNEKGELVNADLRPIFTWFQKRQGERPMATWRRNIANIVEYHPDGVVVRNVSDQKLFFLRNYPYKVPPNTEIHIFTIDSGFHSYKDSAGNQNTVHAADYGIPYNPATEKKSTVKKETAGTATNTVPRK